MLKGLVNTLKLTGLVIFSLATGLTHADTQMYFVHSDHLGTAQKLTDGNQNVVWEVDSQTPFGEADINDDADGDGQTVEFNLRFPGQYFDKETGTHYNYFRTYDPSLGRYLQSDPIGLEGGINTYGYVGGNPIIFIDANGLDKTRWFNSTGGRSLSSGPTNGNWGGKDWSGGQAPSTNGGTMGNASPIDSADYCARDHDMCWHRCDGGNMQCVNEGISQDCKDTCDLQFKECLLKLNSYNARNWPVPPPKGTERDSKNWQHGGIYLGGKNFFRHR